MYLKESLIVPQVQMEQHATARESAAEGVCHAAVIKSKCDIKAVNNLNIWSYNPNEMKVCLISYTCSGFYQGTHSILEEESHIKDALSRITVEMIKREWPQHWPDMLKEMEALTSQGVSSTLHCAGNDLILLISRRLACSLNRITQDLACKLVPRKISHTHFQVSCQPWPLVVNIIFQHLWT